MSLDFNAINGSISQAILDDDRLSDLLNELGFNHTETKNGEFRGACPVHCGDNPTSCVVKVGGRDIPIRWTCFTKQCHVEFKPSLVGFVRGVLSAGHQRPVNVHKAIAWLREFSNSRWSSIARPRVVAPKKAAVWKPRSLTRMQVRARLQLPSPYFVARGFSATVLDEFDIGHSDRLGGTVIPIYDDFGSTCISYALRTELPECGACKLHHPPTAACGHGEPKWRFEQGFPKGNYLYGYAKALNADFPYFTLIVEGPGDVWAAAAAGVPAVACCGVELTPQQRRLLYAIGRQPLLAFDNDDAGRAGAKRAAARNDPIIRVRPVPAEFHDVGDMPPDAIRSWLRAELPRRCHAGAA